MRTGISSFIGRGMHLREGKQPVRSFLSWLGDLHQVDAETISPAQRELSDILLIGLPVLPGFVLTGVAWQTAIGGKDWQRNLSKILASIDWRNDRAVVEAGKQLCRQMEKATLSSTDEKTLQLSYERLCEQFGGIRSVILTPSLVGSQSYAFTFHAESTVVSSYAQLSKNIRALYSQIFAYPILSPELVKALFNDSISVSILVQPYVDARAAGTVSTVSTVSGVVIEAILGRPEPLAEKRFLPDRYSVDLDSTRVTRRDCNRQTWQLLSSGEHKKVPQLSQSSQKLEEEEILEVAKFAHILTSQHDFPLELAWLQDSFGKFWISAVSLSGKIVASAIASPTTSSTAEYLQPTVDPIVFGKGVGGSAVGTVVRLRQSNDLNHLTDKNILVVESLHHLPEDFGNDDLPSAIVAETGRLSDIAPSFDIPVIVGAKGALHKLADGQMVTVNGARGTVAVGSGKIAVTLPTGTVTGVKLYEHTLSLHEEPAADSDGVGLLSIGLLYERLAIHPKQSLSEGSAKLLQADIVDELCVLASGRPQQPIFLATHDWMSDQYRALPHGAKHEPVEKNPLIGYRGGGRALRQSDLFSLELQALRQARDEFGHENLHLMLGFVRTIKELTALHHMVTGAGLRPGPHFKLWLLAQVPANLTLLRSVAKRGLIQGVCLDMDSLTQLLLGADAKNEELVGEYDMCEPTVLETISESIAFVRKAGLSVTVCGKTLGEHPEAIEAIVSSGVTGIVLDSTQITSAHQLIASIEQRLMLDHLRA